MAKRESFALMALKRILHIPAKLPYFVQIDMTNVCNLSCGICPIHYLDIKKTHIDYEVFKEIIDRLCGVEEVCLVGLGEPLTHPKIMEAISYCNAKGMIVKLTTNGILLNNDEVIRGLINSGLDSISFSLDSISENTPDEIAHRDNRVLRNIERLIALKEEIGSCTPKVSIQTVLFKNRQNDVYEIIKWAAANRVHRVNVLRMHLFFKIDAKRPDAAEEKNIFKEFARLRAKYKVRVDCLQDQFYDGIEGFLYKHLKYFLRLDNYCARLIDFPVISQKGDMIPCCVLPDYKFGNILLEGLKEVWHGEKITDFRRRHNKIERCAKCDCWKIKQVI